MEHRIGFAPDHLMQLSFSARPPATGELPRRTAGFSAAPIRPQAAPPLGAVIVARNEAHNLPRCLASVKGWVAEIVVVLNNTTDNSEAVAQEFGAIVFETEWRGFRDTKNWANDRASQPWALCLDADEEVSAALKDAILGFFAGGAHHRFQGARFPRKLWFIDRWITHGDWYPDHCLRLVNRSRARWSGDAFLHEKMEVRGAVATLPADLHHYPIASISGQVARINPLADLMLQRRRAAGKRFSAAAAILGASWRMIRAYVFRRGFLDGFPGFYLACATAFGALVQDSRLYEHEHRQQPPHA